MASDLKYARIIRAVQRMPWAVMPDVLVRIMDVLEFQASGCKLSRAEIVAHVGMQVARPMRTETVEGGVEVIRLRGIVANHIEQVNDISGPGGTSVEGFRQRFDAAMSNDSVGAIVIDVDSPGGSVEGVPELAAHIRASRGAKPIVAHANTLAASAAYWIASAADEIVMAPSAEVGSIGVFAAHSDLSEALKAKGEKITLIHAGKYKVEGNPFEPLSDGAREHMQGLVDQVYGEFVSAVAAGRGVTPKRVRDGYGEGRAFKAAEASERGMVDRVEEFGATLARLGARPPSSRARAAVPRSPAAFQFL